MVVFSFRIGTARCAMEIGRGTGSTNVPGRLLTQAESELVVKAG